MLEAHELRREYGDRRRSVAAVVDVSLKIGDGELVAVTGRSGSGKSTLLAMLGGLCRPSRGRVIVDGVDVWSLGPDRLADFRARQVGFVLQMPSLLPALRAVDNVALPALLARSDLAAAYARAEMLLRELGLGERLEAHPDELSGGEQCRVALARALVNHPPLLLVDEPTAELDEETERDVVERLVALHRAQGTTLVLATHSAELARRADRIVRLHDGRLEEAEERPSRPVTRPSHPARSLDAPAVARPPAAPGAGLRRFVGSFALWTALVVAGVLALDLAVAAVQQRGTARRQAARSELARAALQELRADVDTVAYGPDGEYRLTLYMEALAPRRELFVLGPAVRVFVQAEGGWREVAARPLEPAPAGVVRVGARRLFSFGFRPDVTAFEEQIAGYYHVRVTSTMLVGHGPEPRDAAWERTDSYYVYVKPHGADDREIRRRNGWSGPPPVWIPMPPH